MTVRGGARGHLGTGGEAKGTTHWTFTATPLWCKTTNTTRRLQGYFESSPTTRKFGMCGLHSDVGTCIGFFLDSLLRVWTVESTFTLLH